MKVFVILAAFAALTAAFELTPSQKAVLKVRAKACAEQEGISQEQALALRAGDFNDSDVKVKCFANCFLERSEVLVNGQVQPGAVLAKLGLFTTEEHVKSVQAKCDSIKGADNCDTAYQLYKCYYQNRAQA